MMTSRSDERRGAVSSAEAELRELVTQTKAERKTATEAARGRRRAMEAFERQFAASVTTAIVPALEYVREEVKDLLDLTVRTAGAGHVVEVALVSTKRDGPGTVLIAFRPDQGTQTVRCLGVDVVPDRLAVAELSEEAVKEMSLPPLRAALKGRWTKDF